uniref:Uncharacterized protein n=1 Tax=Nelumbo nucifera TaxID=4432 RepID=A0A822ZX10_NELNU|nr:TPA_asm: hypothetical protein HUJ06_016395 [Nelumbo nucifera]
MMANKELYSNLCWKISKRRESSSIDPWVYTIPSGIPTLNRWNMEDKHHQPNKGNLLDK